LRVRQSRATLGDDILALGEQAARGEVVWTTFHVFLSEEEEKEDE
jgi:hypothetical protein